MVFKVGRHTNLSISDIKDNSPTKTAEADVKKFDANKDGILDSGEAARYYADKSGGIAPRGIDDVFKLAGGRQHDVKVRHQEYWDVVNMGAGTWRGDFNIPGVGAGNVRTDRQAWNQTDRTNLLVDCDLVDAHFLEHDLGGATLVIGPRGFNPEAGSTLGENVTVPLHIATQPGYQTYNRGGGSSSVPEKKFLAVSMDTEDLRKLAGQSGGLSFYVKLETNDGRNFWINKDGRPFNNFDIDAADIKANNTP
jgi:hypothetical protein